MSGFSKGLSNRASAWPRRCMANDDGAMTAGSRWRVHNRSAVQVEDVRGGIVAVECNPGVERSRGDDAVFLEVEVNGC